MKIASRAPTRIDLAGGTVDLWPLYLFLNQPLTVNLGISLFAEAKLEESTAPAGGSVLLSAGDQDAERQLDWDEFTGEQPIAKIAPQLELHYKLTRYFVQGLRTRDPERFARIRHSDLSLTTFAQSPAGAGLGGSSTLSVAMIGALGSWARAGSGPDGQVDPERDGWRFIEIIRDVETTVIQVPAGLQDYYGAMFGGLQSLRWLPGSHERAWLPEKVLAELEGRLLLFYSGQSRNSGINNWALFKGFIDRDAEIREKFTRINAATQALERALKASDWRAVFDAIEAEWSARRTLAPGISTPQIDQAFAEARKAGPVTGKVCGAGGGGCCFVYLPEIDPAARARVQEIFTQAGMRPLPFRAAPRGLEVRIERA